MLLEWRNGLPDTNRSAGRHSRYVVGYDCRRARFIEFASCRSSRLWAFITAALTPWISEVVVATLCDAPQTSLAAAGVLARNDAQPGAELVAALELLKVTHAFQSRDLLHLPCTAHGPHPLCRYRPDDAGEYRLGDFRRVAIRELARAHEHAIP